MEKAVLSAFGLIGLFQNPRVSREIIPHREAWWFTPSSAYRLSRDGSLTAFAVGGIVAVSDIPTPDRNHSCVYLLAQSEKDPDSLCVVYSVCGDSITPDDEIDILQPGSASQPNMVTKLALKSGNDILIREFWDLADTAWTYSRRADNRTRETFDRLATFEKPILRAYGVTNLGVGDSPIRLTNHETEAWWFTRNNGFRLSRTDGLLTHFAVRGIFSAEDGKPNPDGKGRCVNLLTSSTSDPDVLVVAYEVCGDAITTISDPKK